MATKDNSPGLLSKVAKFVRNPTTDWSDLDNPVSEPDTGYSKQALKEMIERKRQNDFVRRREFDQLRKLRSREAAGVSPDQADRPSFFQTSTASNPDDRAMTLKKIDEIEAQMSRQWWKGRQGEAPVQNGEAPAPQAPPASESDAPDPQATDSLRTAVPRDQLGPAFAVTQTPEPFDPSDAAVQSDFAATQMSPPMASLSGSAGRGTDRGAGFASAKLFAAELGDGITDPDLEEAAIRFANGDDEGAEAGLMEALQSPSVHQDSAHVWTATLFDFYRATGQQGRFEMAAIDFAQRFGRAAPAWFSMPDVVGRKLGASDDRTTPAALAGEPIWQSPADFDIDALDGLNLAVANAASPLFLDWSRLAGIQAHVAEPLGKLFAFWCGSPLQLQFRGAHQLEKILRSHTPSGDRQVGPPWWRLRMDALRIMGLQDEFELAALDYCVTYEVSPPAWVDARCDYIHENPHANGDAQDFGERYATRDADDWAGGRDQALTVPMGLDPAVPVATMELSGEIFGDAADALNRLEMARQGSDRLVISCAHLIRVDFSAAGSILNWVAQRQTEGCQVQFREVHRLVAAFFNVIGIHEHARVVLRAN